MQCFAASAARRWTEGPTNTPEQRDSIFATSITRDSPQSVEDAIRQSLASTLLKTLSVTIHNATTTTTRALVATNPYLARLSAPSRSVQPFFCLMKDERGRKERRDRKRDETDDETFHVLTPTETLPPSLLYLLPMQQNACLWIFP